MKTSLAALSLLLGGFILGWVFKPSSKDVTPENDGISGSGGSLLESTSANRISRNGSPPTGDAPKNLATLLAILEDDSSPISQARAYQYLANFRSKDLLALIQSIDTIGKGNRYRSLALRTITGRWSEIDPESLFAYALTAKDRNLKQQGISRAIQALAKRDRARARALVNTIDDNNLRKEASRQIIRTMAKDDPKAALTALAGETAEARYEYDSLFMTWGKDAPQEAASHLESITNREERRQAIQGLARSWGSSKPEVALDWAMTLTHRLERREAMKAIMSSISDVGKGAALLESLNLKGTERREAINALANKAINSDLDTALQWMETLAPRDRSDVMASQLYSIGKQDPERARQLIDENMSYRLRSVVDNVAAELAQKDPDSAQAWADTLPQGELKDQAIQGLLKTLQQTDPQAAAAYLDSIDVSSRNRNLANNVARSLFDEDPAAALAWIETKDDPNLTRDLLGHWSQQDPSAAAAYAQQLEDPTQQLSALANIMGNWANADPEQAIAHLKTLQESDRPAMLQSMIRGIADSDIAMAVELFESTSASTTDQDSQRTIPAVADDLVDTWASFDVAAAAEWAASLSPEQPNSRTRAIEEAASEWVRQDSLAASEWIGALPAGQARDAAVRRLVNHVRQDDPSAAFAWANTLGDESRRTNELQSVLSQWKQTDQTAALNALQSANLTDEAYNKLAKQLEQ